MRDNDKIIEKSNSLKELTANFCDKFLNLEYKNLCEKLIFKLSRKKNVPFLSGKIEIWAGAIIYALGQINFLFDKSFMPYSTPDEICNFFNITKSTTSQKAKIIRDMFNMNYFDSEFSTNRSKEGNPMKDMVMLDNGLIVTKSNILNMFNSGNNEDSKNNEKEIIVEFIDEEEFENNFLDTFENRITNNESDYSLTSLKLYADYLNKKLKFPFEVMHIEKTDLFGIIENKAIAKKIFQIENSKKTLKNGLMMECANNSQIIIIPIIEIEAMDKKYNELLNQYKKWFSQNNNK